MRMTKTKTENENRIMKTRKTILLATATALLSLAGIQFGNAQTNTNLVSTITNLLPVQFSAICVSSNQNGQLVSQREGNSHLIQECLSGGGTNTNDLTLVFNLTNSSLEVLSGTNPTPICTPFTFSG